MEIKRDILDELIAWKNQARHKPLLLQGARQIGKSWLMEYFGRSISSIGSSSILTEIRS